MSILKKAYLIFILISFFLSSKVLWAMNYEEVIFEKKAPSYSIEVKYPKIIDNSFSPEVKNNINSTIKKFVNNLFEDDLKSFSEQKWSEKELDKMFSRNLVDINFKVIRFDKRILSLRFEKYYYGIGAVHGLTHIYGFNYDIKNLQTIKLKDIFTPKIDYIKQISKYCIKDLHKQLKVKDDVWIKEGASADENNFKDFAIAEKSLIIYFSDYQIGCYAIGTQQVKIPFSELSGLKL